MQAGRRPLLQLISAAIALCAAPVFPATEGARVSGWTLTDDGRPLSGAEVFLACPPAPVRRTVSGEDGRFDLSNLPPGNCRLGARKAGYVDATAEGDPDIRSAYSLKVQQGTWRDGFELRLARGVIITGRITDAHGGPAKNVRVHPIRREVTNGIPSLNPMAYLPVDASGAFEFVNLPAGEYYFGASPLPQGSEAGGSSGYAICYFPGTTDFGRAQPFMVKPGESREVNISLVEMQAFRVSGVAYDFTGRPVVNAGVVLSFETDPKWMTGATRTAADGTFSLTGVQAGKYVLRVSRSLHDVGEMYFDVNDADVGNLIVRVGLRR